jgi:hypothetical protein
MRELSAMDNNMEQEIINVDDDGLSPPEGVYPEEVPGATGYYWDPELQVWVPVFKE